MEAASDIIDTEGLDALTMRNLAARFDVNVASLYHHFRDKDDLLRSVCALIYREIAFPDERTEHWTELTVRTSTDFREAMLRHPNAVPLMARFHPRQVIPGIYESVGTLLVQRGLPQDMIDIIVNAFDALVFGSVSMVLAAGRKGPTETEEISPTLEGWARANPRRSDEEFLLTCRSLGAGLATYIISSRGAPPGPAVSSVSAQR